MSKITIIGANSYIARNVIYVLQKEYPEAKLSLYDAAEEQVDGAEGYRQINILDKESVKNIDMDADIIFMFIGKTGSANGFDDPDVFLDINERALLYVLNEYRRQGSKGKIVFPSTRLVYDHASNASEEDVTEDFKTIYAINKYACEKYLEMYNRVYGVRYSIFRICLPYGTLIPGATSYGTAEFMLGKAEKGEDISLYGDGSVRRTLTHMEDLCLMLIKGAFSEETENSILNIGGEDYSLKEMAEAIAKKYGVGVTYVPYPEVAEKIESGDTVFNDRKYRDTVKYERKHTFQSWIDS